MSLVSQTRFSCRFCETSFLDNYELTEHYKIGCPNRHFSFNCPTCSTKPFTCSVPLEATRHVANCKTKGNDYVTCCQCFEKVKQQEFAIHYHNDILKYFLPDNPYKHKCHTCDLNLPNAEDLRDHQSRHMKPDKDESKAMILPFQRYSCSVCYVSHFTKKSIISHMTEEHGLKIGTHAVVTRAKQKDNKMVNGRKAVYTCYVCEELFYCRYFVIWHIRKCEQKHGYKTTQAKTSQFLKQPIAYMESQKLIYCKYCHVDLTNTPGQLADVHMESCEKKMAKRGERSETNFEDCTFCPVCKKAIGKHTSNQLHIHECGQI